MSCIPNHIELSNTATTTVNVTISPDPGNGTAVTFQADGLSIDLSGTTTSGAVAFTVASLSTAATNSLWDCTIQVASNSPAVASVQVVDTNAAQAVGVTVSDAGVTYCSPGGGGGGVGTVTSVLATSPIVSDGDTSTPTLTHTEPLANNATFSYVQSVSVSTFGHITAISGVESAAAFRSSIGLKTAAVLDTGTTAGDVVVLDGSAKLPAVDGSQLTLISDNYTGQIETAAVKTYTIDPSAVHARTVTAFYARSGFGSCTAVLKNEAATVGTVTVTTTSGLAPSIAAASLLVNGLLSIQITTNSAATDVVFSVEDTQ